MSAEFATTPEEVVDGVNERYGRHPGYRTLHAKGRYYEATFTATPEAARLTRAYGGETVACGDSGVLRHSFPSIRRNNDIHACAGAGIVREYRRDYRLVIGVRDHRNECPSL